METVTLNDDGILIRMRNQAAAWEAGDDKRFIFLRCYSMMTANMIEAISATRFQDGAWVGKLLVRFADYYFDALDRYEQGSIAVPAVWKQVHDASLGRNLHVLQHLLLGINAHINYDLVLALYDEMEHEWEGIPVEVREIRMADHSLVNTIIGETIDAVQDQVIERALPVMRLVDNLMGRMDEWLLSELITNWRSEVWEETCVLLAERSVTKRASRRAALEEKVMRRANGILDF